MKLHKYEDSAGFTWITGNKDFKIFMVSGCLLRYDCPRYKQEYVLFNEYDYYDAGSYNSGERKLLLLVNSEEEQKELIELFTKFGFKVRQKDSLSTKNKTSVWFSHDCKNQYYPKNEDAKKYLYNIELEVYIKKRSLKEFFDFLKIISKQYKYKTIWYSHFNRENRIIL